MHDAEKSTSSKNPFAYKAFAVLWVATVLSNIGTWIHDVGAGWLMTSLSHSSPAWVSLSQAATTLPVFLLALPSGALADIVNRKKMLVLIQAAMIFVAAGLGVTVALGIATPSSLVCFTFFMGVGAAATAPAWQAIVPNLIPRQVLQQAVALNSLGINISRAVGPVLAALIIAAAGSAAPFFANALSYSIVVTALLWWKAPLTMDSSLPPEYLPGAMRAGVRYVLHSSLLRAPLVKAVSFFVFASAYWALLPVIAKKVLQGDVNLYGMLVGCIGAGAVLSAIFLPRIRRRLSSDVLVIASTIGTAIAMCVFAVVKQPYIVAAFCLVAGASWIIILTVLNTSVQTGLPNWVRARGLAVFVMVFFGSQTLGSLVWGQVAAHASISIALLTASVGILVAMLLTLRISLPDGDSADLAPSAHWPEPLAGKELAHDRGPVFVTIEYLINPDKAAYFAAAMNILKQERLRDGAYAWGVFESVERPGLYLEYFIVDSWLEHLRQHDRVTVDDCRMQAEALAFHIGNEPPRVSHFIAPDR